MSNVAKRDAIDVELADYPELVSSAALQVRDVILKCGIEKNVADNCALATATHLIEQWGGQNIYFPRGHQTFLARRYRQIYQEFNGMNTPDLARKYGVSRQRVYQIIKSVRSKAAEK